MADDTTGQPADTGTLSGGTTTAGSGTTPPATTPKADAPADPKRLLAEFEEFKASAAAREKAWEAKFSEARDGRDKAKETLRLHATAEEDAAKKRGDFEALVKQRDTELAEVRKAQATAQVEAQAAIAAKTAAEATVDTLRLSYEWRAAFLTAGGDPADIEVVELLGRQLVTDGKLSVKDGKAVGIADEIKALKEKRAKLFASAAGSRGAPDTGRAAVPAAGTATGGFSPVQPMFPRVK